MQSVGCPAPQLEASGRVSDAIACYLPGLEVDELVEDFYQGLMRYYDTVGSLEEAVLIYQRMRQTLSVVLGVGPSSASERIYRSLLRM